MEPVLNPLLFDSPEPIAPRPEDAQSHETRRPKTSRAAECIAALYIALLVCTPWLVRDASFFRPSSTTIEMHLGAAAPLGAGFLTAPSPTR